MSAKDDYACAKDILDAHPGITDKVRTSLVDNIRSAITSARIAERVKAARLLKDWAESLESNDEEYVAIWFRDVADRIKNDQYTGPEFLPDSTATLIAEDEREL